MDDITVSVVVPTLNRKNSLKKCIFSLFNQTYPQDKYEIIVCDDGSSDGTEDMVMSLIEDTRCNLKYFKVDSKFKGPSTARNFGVENARGHIIGFTDDDCIVHPKWIETAVNYLENELIGGVQGKVIPQKVDDKNISKRIFKVTQLVSHTEDNGRYVTSNLFIRKSLIIKAGGFDPEFVRMQDTDLGYRIKNLGYEVIFCDDVITYHEVRYISYIRYLKALKKFEYLALLIKKNPQVRETLYLGFIERKRHVYPIFVILTIVSFLLIREFVYLFLLISIIAYLWGRVIRDSNVKQYPLRFIAIIRYFIIDTVALYYTLRGAIRYRCFVI